MTSPPRPPGRWARGAANRRLRRTASGMLLTRRHGTRGVCVVLLSASLFVWDLKKKKKNSPVTSETKTSPSPGPSQGLLFQRAVGRWGSATAAKGTERAEEPPAPELVQGACAHRTRARSTHTDTHTRAHGDVHERTHKHTARSQARGHTQTRASSESRHRARRGHPCSPGNGPSPGDHKQGSAPPRAR